jgi:hypothetical protein
VAKYAVQHVAFVPFRTFDAFEKAFPAKHIEWCYITVVLSSSSLALDWSPKLLVTGGKNVVEKRW